VFADAANDIPEFLGSYDIVSVQVSRAEDQITVKITTREPIDRFNAYGFFQVEALSYTAGTATSLGGIAVDNGIPYLQKKSGESLPGSEKVRLTTSGNELQLAFAASEFFGATSSADQILCVRSITEIDGPRAVDAAGCPVIQSAAARGMWAAADRFGLARHQIQVVANDQAQAEKLAKISLQALRDFEELLNRPLYQRHLWKMHVYTSQPIPPAHASLSGGIYLNFSAAASEYGMAHLAVEQLARQVLADHLESSSPPFWVQEMWIQWLSAAALQRQFPATDVQNYLRRRINEYLAFVVDGQRGRFSDGDVPLTNWNLLSLNSTGSIKSMMFALVLDAELGPAAMGRSLGLALNMLPGDSAVALKLFKAVAPDKALRLTELWNQYVLTTSFNNIITDAFSDSDGNGTFKFQDSAINQ
jgi:hypothetical protein